MREIGIPAKKTKQKKAIAQVKKACIKQLTLLMIASWSINPISRDPFNISKNLPRQHHFSLHASANKFNH